MKFYYPTHPSGTVIAAISVALAVAAGHLASAQTAANATWDGNGNHNGSEKNGNWSDATLWTPQVVPNNAGNTVYDVTVPWDPNGDQFNGPEVDVNVTVRNLNMVNRVFLDNQGTCSAFPSCSSATSLTVTGSSTFSVSSGHNGEYGAVFWAGSVCSLGTLTNFNASTNTLESGFLFPLAGGTIQFHGADIVTNNGTIVVGDNSSLLNQDNGQPAYKRLAVNNGGFNLGGGHDFTTVGDFTNNGGLSVGNSTEGLSTTFTVAGSLTNFDPSSHTLSGGQYSVVNNANTGSVTLRFAGADIRTISFANVDVHGPGASIKDLAGNDALRNLSTIQGSTFTSGGIQTYTPAGGTLTNNGTTHNIAPGSNITVQGNFNVTNGGQTVISAPTDNSNTVVVVTGSMLIDSGSSMDMGGQPGVTTQYHTQLQVINGIEYRGAFLTGTGTTFADVLFTQNAHVQPGHSPGQLSFEGAVSFDSTTTTVMQIGGTSAGDGYDQIVQTGSSAVTLGGTLDLSFVDGFDNSIANSDTFDIITSENQLAGSFVNVASGDRLYTSDGIGSFIVTYADQNTVTLSDYIPVPLLVSAVMRETHGEHGTFDLPLNLTGKPSVESRGVDGTHHIVLTFNNPIADGDVTLSAPTGGTIEDGPTFTDNTISVTLSGMTNKQRVTVNLQNVTDQYSQVLPDRSVTFDLLLGDVNGDGSVNSADATATRNSSGHTADSTNYLADFNLDGTINSADATTVRSHSGDAVTVPKGVRVLRSNR